MMVKRYLRTCWSTPHRNDRRDKHQDKENNEHKREALSRARCCKGIKIEERDKQAKNRCQEESAGERSRTEPRKQGRHHSTTPLFLVF